MVSIEVTAVIEYAGNYMPWLTEASGDNQILSTRGVAAAAAMIAVFTLINLAGVKWMARSNVAITLWKVTVPVLVPIALIVAGFHLENFTS
jgi:amino acid transporter